MKKRICPVCDREMQSSNYCKTCHRFVRNPYIRDINYYLNEAHPRGEADCNYHNAQAVQSRPIGQVGQTQIPVRPQAGWQRQTPSGGAAAPAYQTSQMVQPARTTTSATRTVKKKESNKWILFLAAFFVVIFLGASQFFRFAANQINDMGYGRSYAESPPHLRSAESDVDLGSYEQDLDPTEWDEEEWKELEDDEVRAAGERCTGNAHFSVTLDELESEVVQIIENHGYQMQNRDSYSYNTQYGGGDEYTSYCTWTSYEIEQEQSETEQYLYQDVYFDHDTVTDELHSIELTLVDMAQVIAISGEVLDLMVTKEMVSSAEDYEQILTEIDQQSFYDEGYYTTADGRVEIWCYEYDDSYCIYICPSEEYE